PVRQASNWSGGQVGGSNGGSFANNAFADPGSYICPLSFPLGQSCFETPFSFTGHSASYTIGPFLGYRVQLGAFVLGIEGDASYKNTSDSVSQTTVTIIGGSYSRTDYFTGSLRQGWDSSVRGRVGVLVTPWTLIYGTGGVAFERVSGSLAYTGALSLCSGGNPCSQVGTATAITSFSETRVGATGGAGVEFQLFGPWSARLEYRYTDFGSFSKSAPVVTSCSPGGCASPSPGATIDLHPSFHTVRVGLGFGF
ncbi:MAG: outer membrane protein, partial [Rhodoplanes sp.]